MNQEGDDVFVFGKSSEISKQKKGGRFCVPFFGKSSDFFRKKKKHIDSESAA